MSDLERCPTCGHLYYVILPEWCEWWYNPSSPTKGREWKEAYDMAVKQASNSMKAKWNGRRLRQR